jgi:hypothetical protein
MILKDLRVFTVSNLSTLDSITYVFALHIACKSMILKNFKSFRRLPLRGASIDAILASSRGENSHFGTQLKSALAISVRDYYSVIQMSIEK